MIQQILKNGIYYIQTDDRQNGYYIKSSKGNLVKKEFKISFLDKLFYLIFNKEPNNPIATSFLLFKLIDGDQVVFSGYHSGDVSSVAKDVKKNYRLFSQRHFKHLIDSIEIDFEDRYIEMGFDKNGKNIKSIIKIKETNEIKVGQSYNFLSWDNL